MPAYFIAYTSLESNNEKLVSKESHMCQWTAILGRNVHTTEGTLRPGERISAFETHNWFQTAFATNLPIMKF